MENAHDLAEKLEHLQSAFQNVPVIFFVQDVQLRYVWMHPQFPGLRAAGLLGKTDADLLPEEEARRLISLKQAALSGGVAQRGFVRMTFQGQTRFYFVSVHPEFADSGVLKGLVGAAVDMSEARGAESVAQAGVTSSLVGLSDTRARLLASLSRSFAEMSSDYPALLKTTTRLVAEAAGDAALIQLVDEEGRLLLPAAFYHTDPGLERLLRPLIEAIPQEDLFRLVDDLFRDGQPAAVEDLATRGDLLKRLPADLRAALARHPIHAMLWLPLRTSRGMLGLLGAWRSRSQNPYSAEDISLWQDVAERAALAIENARLYAEEVRRNRQLNALHDATMALLSTLDLEVLLGRILDSAQQAIPAADHGVLYLVAPRTGRLEVRATTGFSDPRIRRTGFLRNSYANLAMRERRPLLVVDAFQDAPARGLPSASGDDGPETVRSAILAPLLLGDEVLGALSLSSARLGAFHQSDLHLLASFAATTTAALHNAMLHSELQQIAITDPLTGLYNRRGLFELGRHEVERFQRFGQPLSAIMLDIDHFKRVNDTYGHAAGDQVLRGLSERCSGQIRQVDILSRYGGEEFFILLPETDLFQAATVAERLRRAVEDEPFITEQGPVIITISLGVSRAGRGLAGLPALIDQADAALYQAKQQGRNRVEIA